MDSIGVGIVGTGGFAHFVATQLNAIEGVQLVAATDTNTVAAISFAHAFGIGVALCDSLEQLVARADVDVVYIATPPALHFPQAKVALTANKHVVCEKPLALNVDQCDELIQIAQTRDLMLVADMMQRYNPLFATVQQLLASNLLGATVRASFENDASNDTLPHGHWFWDHTMSGGIFVEHAVHFFDLLEGWLGDAEVTAGWEAPAGDHADIDRVWCAMSHAGGVTSTMYHGFHQRRELERQLLRIVCQNGDITLDGWIPMRIAVRAADDRVDLQRVQKCLLDGSDTEAEFTETTRDGTTTLALGIERPDLKALRYAQMVRSLLEDQFAWIADRSHQRIVTARNGRRSVMLACRATNLARKSH